MEELIITYLRFCEFKVALRVCQGNLDTKA